MELWSFVSMSGLVILVDEGQNIIFGQFLRVHPRLRIVNYDPVDPRPEEPLRVADAADEDEGSTSITIVITMTNKHSMTM